ncbi:unnamed protein product [Polarella glacialis]|uniref:Uncharacterized protein n=1 Tax=Polarella glacialis TaxID=89957 RepID=A0A813G4K1_POLGL|nr:unnamed protein product [Polarella glacialis]
MQLQAGESEAFASLLHLLREALRARQQQQQDASSTGSVTASRQPHQQQQQQQQQRPSSSIGSQKSVDLAGESRTGDELVRPEDFVWSLHPFNGGDIENARVLRDFENQYVSFVERSEGRLTAPGLLRATLDLAGAYIKNYSLDKADLLLVRALPECRRRGPPWDMKCLQDMATLRFKQNRQPECARLLEELAASSPPHPITQENLGRVPAKQSF